MTPTIISKNELREIEEKLFENCHLTERISNQRKIYFKAVPEICSERPCLVTSYHRHRDEELLQQNQISLFEQDKISILEKANAYRYVLENKSPKVVHKYAYDENMQRFGIKEHPLFAGSTTSKFKGVPLYPELLDLALWPELLTVSKRESNPYHIAKSEIDMLNHRVFPYWIDKSILELTRSEFYNHRNQIGLNNEFNSIQLLEKLVFFLASKPKCISHTIPDFSIVIGNGLGHIIKTAKTKMQQASDDQIRDFYSAICEVSEGIITYSHNLASEAENLANKESNSNIRDELYEIAKIHRKIPECKAGSFREGLTAIWICWIAIHVENPNVGLSLGRIDQVLYKLFIDDFSNGKLSLAEAVELVCALWLKLGDHVPAIPDASEKLFGGTGSNQAITIGGVDKDGNDAVNILTYVILRATELMKLRDPNLNARYYPPDRSFEKPSPYLKRLCKVNISTGATPAIHNDRAVIKALQKKGDTLEHARDYGVTGCVEPGSNGRFYGASASILMNLTSILELTVFEGTHRHLKNYPINMETANPDNFKSFYEFRQAFKKQLTWMAKKSTELNNNLGIMHQRYYPTPILSAIMKGPMDTGMDVIEGGALINSSGVTIIGLADVADSLTAIEKLVFEKKRYSLKEFKAALKNNFKGHEELYQTVINSDRDIPKFGNDEDDDDRNVDWLIRLIDDVFGKMVHYRGGSYRVGYWTMTNHAGFGRLMGATPNGRKAYENFASGLTPVSKVTPELSKMLNSVAKIPHKYISNGMALNLKYIPENGNNQKMLNDFVASVQSYFDDSNPTGVGGMEIQFNVIDHETLIDAYLNPGKNEHAELLVRVSGYTAYFKDLNKRMQKEIIDRTEYRLGNGKMRSFPPIPLEP